MSVKVSEWDPANYLDNDEVRTAYLKAALEDGDPKLIKAAIDDIGRSRGVMEGGPP
ncbi:DNA-binding protein [Methylobacterium gnaphalii]|uniref:Addiction module antidote protein n=1 Tax=Methylobacterium gnaphalii TaxID=1010610 RepID=A0A512JRG2_9HYPH|nr:hypothetical protein [Methylobacterium gnaphalii]GEP12547.1 hypothetical protein MGN01_43920 [Methylobacterium gnaphalii]GJD70203.1 hypothetical protein MMMDOFMJ_3145 [Methylobacterium gnaphalii]GLS51514.1 hypothetical protein GCM10007885_43720 [Methylobacterium gnaphalii]